MSHWAERERERKGDRFLDGWKEREPLFCVLSTAARAALRSPPPKKEEEKDPFSSCSLVLQEGEEGGRGTSPTPLPPLSIVSPSPIVQNPAGREEEEEEGEGLSAFLSLPLTLAGSQSRGERKGRGQ